MPGLNGAIPLALTDGRQPNVAAAIGRGYRCTLQARSGARQATHWSWEVLRNGRKDEGAWNGNDEACPIVPHDQATPGNCGHAYACNTPKRRQMVFSGVQLRDGRLAGQASARLTDTRPASQVSLSARHCAANEPTRGRRTRIRTRGFGRNGYKPRFILTVQDAHLYPTAF